MPEQPESLDVLRKEAQKGRAMIKEAIVGFLELRRGKRLNRSEIEDFLALQSEYFKDGKRSYSGSFAAMLLNELAQQDKRICSELGYQPHQPKPLLRIYVGRSEQK